MRNRTRTPDRRSIAGGGSAARRRIAVGAAAVLAAAAIVVPAALAATDGAAAQKGAAWLARAVPATTGTGQSADTAVALRAAGTLSSADAAARAAGLRKGARAYAVTPGAAGKVALGLVALGASNPGCAGGVDLVAKLRPKGNGRFGTTIFDQTLAILALKALHRPIPSIAVRYLQRSRGAGGWSVLPSQSDDVSSTAMAILALRAAGVSAKQATLVKGVAWLGAQRTASGGFALGRKDRNESNSTALAIEAYAALGRHDDRALRALQGLQRGDGSFNFAPTDSGSRVIASTDAVAALAGKHPPVVSLRRPAGGC